MSGRGAGEFVIREDGDVISQYESQQTIHPISHGFDLVSVLLLDMSGSIIESGNLHALQGAANTFIDRIAGRQRVAIHIFDGREELQELVDFSTDAGALHTGIDSLTGYTPVNPTTNLNGAIVEGIGILDDQVAASSAPIVDGSLVVFTDGSDQADWVSDGAAIAVASGTLHSIFTIGLRGEIDQTYLETIGKDGSEFASDATGIADAFDAIAEQIEEESIAFYVLEYCSPKRSGSHELTLELDRYNGSLQYTFSADGFGPGCDLPVYH